MPLPNSSSFTSYGGTTVDYLRAPANTNTDRSAGEINQALLDLAQGTRMVPRAFVTFLGSSSPAVISYEAVWKGNGANAMPVIAAINTGLYTVTFPTSVFDEVGNSYPCNLRASLVNVRGQTLAFALSQPAANVVTVKTFNASGTAAHTGFSFDLVLL